jgi:immunoglobulin-like protein involved in spore germination/sporulation and spore germination protein
MLGSHTGGGGLTPVLRTIPKTQAVGAASMTELLAGPVGGELSADPAMFSDIPFDARFLGLSIANGVATVNLSSEFAAGGTTATIEQRYGQVVFTLTQFATVKSVRFQLDAADAPAVTDSGPVSRAVTRLDYVGVIPAIFVDGPAWGGAVANPARFTGLAYAFEAQFRLQLVAADDTTLVDTAVHASCGTGCWGTFDVTVPYAVAAAQWGTLRVFELSAADSRPVNVTEYPVWLTPPG